ncbi:MAG TPA: hypothetical protein VIY90_18980 [Steroidobacteraceae bacterium]
MSKASRLLIMSAALAALGLADVRAATDQSAPTNDGSSATERLQEVTVTAQRAKLADRLTAFISKISGPQFDGGLPLWGQPVCPLVSGLAQEEGEFIVGRVSDIARAGRVPLAGGKCHPNLYILVTMQPQELLKAMMTKRNFQFTFGISYEPMDGTPIVPSHIVLDDFISKPGPVRVLYRDAPVAPSGVHPIVHAAKVGPITYSGDTWTGNSSWYLFRVFVIVDASQLKGVTLGQLADYAALVGLTEIKPVDSLADAPTILQLFNGTKAAPAGMTEWDRAFLKSLYTTPPHKPAQQRWHVVQTMTKEIVH